MTTDLVFQDSRSGFRARDFSPDSVIFSLFSSSSSGSVERSSFASSDVLDHYSFQSQPQHELSKALNGLAPDPNKFKLVDKKKSIGLITKQKAKEDDGTNIDSTRNSFSQALKECQERRLKSEILSKKPASLDSPRLLMNRPSAKPQKTGTFPSPGTPNYRHSSVGVQKGWSSERIPLHSSSSRRNMNTALFSYNNGKNLPSKWEDAERWIFSPVSGDGATRNSFQQHQRKPKSKSGPLGAPGVAYYQMFSPAVPMFENNGRVIANSPFSAGVMATNGLSIQYRGCESSGDFLVKGDPCMARSISLHGCSELLGNSSLHQHHDKKYDGTGDATNDDISRDVSRRDMATQMSPESSIHSSPRRLSSFSLSTPSILPIVESQNTHSAGPEIRDVPIDERVTITRWNKKNRRAVCEVSRDTSTSISKIQREEAKITVWENLQKEKAEASIKKLEMKLEKKKASSMDKIMNKLRNAQKTAQEMRSSVLDNQAHDHKVKSSNKVLSLRRTRKIGSFSGCFTCMAS